MAAVAIAMIGIAGCSSYRPAPLTGAAPGQSIQIEGRPPLRVVAVTPDSIVGWAMITAQDSARVAIPNAREERYYSVPKTLGLIGSIVLGLQLLGWEIGP